MKRKLVKCIASLLAFSLVLGGCSSKDSSEDAIFNVPTDTAELTTETQTEESQITESKTEESETATAKKEKSETEESETKESKTTESKTTESETTESETTESETTESDTTESETTESETTESAPPEEVSDFVLVSEAVPDAILEIRYYSTYNFVGDRIDGYEEPVALLTKEAATALKEVSDELVEKGYRLKIYDAYRPQSAVDNFVEWAEDTSDTRMKAYFYPELDKSVLFDQGYIAGHSGHSRGSTVDLTLFDMSTEKEVDMGGTFDYFGELSHPDYTNITDEQYANRMLLRDAMTRHGFKAITTEWWHFTLSNEPYPNTYFNFPVNSSSVSE